MDRGHSSKNPSSSRQCSLNDSGCVPLAAPSSARSAAGEPSARAARAHAARAVPLGWADSATQSGKPVRICTLVSEPDRCRRASSAPTMGARSCCSLGRGRSIEKVSHLFEMRLRSGRPRGQPCSVAPMAAAACAGKWWVLARDVASRARSAPEAASARQHAPPHEPSREEPESQPPPHIPPACPLSTADAGLAEG